MPHLLSVNSSSPPLPLSVIKDAMQDQPYNSVPKTSKLQSGPTASVIKMVLNTQCDLYLWLTMWFHAKKIKRNTQKTKIADFTMKWVKMENRWQKFYPPADSDRRDKSHLWWLYWNWSFFLFFSAEIMVIFLESDVMFGFLDIRSPCTLQDRPERW